MNTRLARWGNSVAVRLPKDALDRAGLREGDPLEVAVGREGTLTLRRARRRYTVDELVADIPAGGDDEGADWGAPAGREAR